MVDVEEPVVEPGLIFHVLPKFNGEPEHSNKVAVPCWCEPEKRFVQSDADGLWGVVWVHNRPT